MRVGFIGLGTMGGGMARHLLGAGHDMTVYDVVDGAMEPFAEGGATAAGAPVEVARASEVVFLSLPGPDDVEAVVTASDGLAAGLDEGDVLVDTTTSTPDTTEGVADRLRERGAHVLGAPVSRGPPAARDGTLATMVGGDPAVLESVRPLIEAYATDVFHVGDRPGHGHAVKLLNNYLSFVGLIATSEATVLGQQVGLDMETMIEVFDASSGRNSSTDVKFPESVIPRSFDYGFPLALMAKDSRLLQAFAEDAGTPMLLSGVVHDLIGYARNAEDDDADMTRVYAFLEDVMAPE